MMTILFLGYEIEQALHARPEFTPGNSWVIGEPNTKLICGYDPTMDSVHM